MSDSHTTLATALVAAMANEPREKQIERLATTLEFISSQITQQSLLALEQALQKTTGDMQRLGAMIQRTARAADGVPLLPIVAALVQVEDAIREEEGIVRAASWSSHVVVALDAVTAAREGRDGVQPEAR